MSYSNSLRIQHVNKSDTPVSKLFTRSCSVLVMCACMIAGQHARAAGGCGSVCLPLAATEQGQHLLRQNQYRVGLVTERAVFDNFREGNDDIFNPGGNKPILLKPPSSLITAFLKNSLLHYYYPISVSAR